MNEILLIVGICCAMISLAVIQQGFSDDDENFLVGGILALACSTIVILLGLI